MGIKLTNNAVSRLAGGISTTDVTISLVPGDGALFPSLSAGDWFPATLLNSGGDFEIAKCTGRSADTLTIQRAQEGTSARAFNAGDRVELRLTASVFAALQSDLIALFPPGFGPLPWSRVNPPDGWIWSDGRILLAASPYAALRSAYIADGFPYGSDGAGNPKIPDMRGRVPAGLDNMSGAAGRLSGATLGAGLGAQTHTLSYAEMPVHAHGVTDPTHAHSVYDPGHTHGINRETQSAPAGSQYRVNGAGSAATTSAAATGISIYGAYTGVSIQNAGSGGAHNNVQPTLATYYIVKV